MESWFDLSESVSAAEIRSERKQDEKRKLSFIRRSQKTREKVRTDGEMETQIKEETTTLPSLTASFRLNVSS